MAIDRYSYPFTAIVGQDEMKLALVLNAINPTIGGVLVVADRVRHALGIAFAQPLGKPYRVGRPWW